MRRAAYSRETGGVNHFVPAARPRPAFPLGGGMMLARPFVSALRWHGAQRRRPLVQRIALALAVVGATFVLRVVATTDPLGAGRDLLLLGVLVAALLFGLGPGLCAAFLARGLSIWWYVAPDGAALVPAWDVPGIAIFLVLAVIAAALAGQTLQLLANPEDEAPAPPRVAPDRPDERTAGT
jgi:hypothetical protein